MELDVELIASNCGSERCVAVFVGLTVYEPVQLTRSATVRLPDRRAATWHRHTILVQSAPALPAIKESALELTDIFLGNWEAANAQ
jgi:hypothetical protein